MTPNYVDSSPTGIVVSPWCSCRGSGNMEEECEKFLRDFTENPCLRKSYQVLPVPLTSRRSPAWLPWPPPSFSAGMLSVIRGAFPATTETWGCVLLETAPAEWSVGQPQSTTGGLEAMSRQGQKFLVCYPESFSQVPSQHLSLVSLRIHSRLELVTFFSSHETAVEKTRERS